MSRIATATLFLVVCCWSVPSPAVGQANEDALNPANSQLNLKVKTTAKPDLDQRGVQRDLWDNTRLLGSPDPPLPYAVTPAFPRIRWDRPLYAKAVPNSSCILVILQGGETDRPSRVVQVDDREDADQTLPLIEIPERLAYGLEFHPQFAQNGFVYLFTNGKTGETERRNRVSRFTLQPTSEGQLSCDLSSELIILEWRSMGHDGGDLCFGQDGMLYISSGDGTSDSDNWLSAQDTSNLLGGVLRIDVDNPVDGLSYSIPSDNPFLADPNARGELWAIGLRNPWRMSVDQKTGQIWIGNNGQDLWESVHLLGRGENYGWSVFEGSHPFYSHRQLGPGKLTVPTFEHHHQEARSLTGGVVYYGQLWPELHAAYLYGDYATGRIWAARHDGTQVLWHRLIADTVLQIACFSNTPRGEILIVDHAGEIYRLTPNPAASNTAEQAEFPRLLSRTGLFESTADHRLAPGVIEYQINSPGWNDGAEALRFMALPGDATIEYSERRGWKFPDKSVLIQTLMWPEDGSELAKRRLETRILIQTQSEWAGYSYVWNQQQNDATLVDAEGQDLVLGPQGPNGSSSDFVWRIPSRAECMSCHSRAVNYVLGLSHLQIDHNVTTIHGQENQLRNWQQMGLFSGALPANLSQDERLVDPYDVSQDRLARVKAYLHTNCSSCHVETGGGNSRMELEWTTPLDKMNIVASFPQHDAFGFTQPRIVSSGKPDQSVLLARLSRRGRGQMPPLVSRRVDQKAVELFQEWIASLTPERPFVRNWQMDDFADYLAKVDPTGLSARGESSSETQSERPASSLENGQRVFREAGCGQCHRIRDEMAGIGPNLAGISSRRRPTELLDAILNPSQLIEPQYANSIVLTDIGQIFQGRIVEETEESLVLRDTDAPDGLRRILKSEIEHRSLSKLSPMPAGILNDFQRQEIIDLMAYMMSEGRDLDERDMGEMNMGEINTYEYRVSRLSEPMSLDAEWDKSPWTQVPALQLNHAMGEPPVHFPKTQLKMAYDDQSLVFIFRVEDRFVRAVAEQHQDAVYKDSCVEFFFTPKSDSIDGYFNLEMNCSGVMLFHFQKVPRMGSLSVSGDDLQKLEVAHSLPKRVEPEIEQPTVWTVECRLPIAVLRNYFPNLEAPAPGVRWKANFQKCADDSSHPHWLTWAKIDHPTPDFHRPQSFGTLVFE